MLTLGILLVVLSPYTALIPALFMGYRIYCDREIIFHDPAVYKSPWNLALGFVFIWAVLSGLMNHSFGSIAAACIIPLYFMVSVYMQHYFCDEWKSERLIHMVMLGSVASAFIGIVEKVASWFIDMSWMAQLFWSPTYIMSPDAYRIYSTFGNPNVAGGWFAAMVIVSLYFFEKASGRQKIPYGLAMILFVGVLALTGSKGAVLGMEFGFLAYAFLKPNRRNILPLALAFVMVLLMILFAPAINHPVNSRDAIWMGCMELFKQKPIMGWGLLGIYQNLHEIHGHSIWFSISAMLGTFGLAAYGIMMFYLIRNIRFLYQEGSQLVAVLGAVQAVIIGHGIVDFTILTPQGGMMFFGGSALIYALATQYNLALDMDDDLVSAWMRSPKYYRRPPAEGEKQYRSTI